MQFNHWHSVTNMNMKDSSNCTKYRKIRNIQLDKFEKLHIVLELNGLEIVYK